MSRNRNRHRDNRNDGHNYRGNLGGAGLLGESPGGGDVASQINQLVLAQQLLQQQAVALAASGDIGGLGIGGFLQQRSPPRSQGYGSGRMNDRKRTHNQRDRDNFEYKRRRNDSHGHGNKNRSNNRNQDGNRRDRNRSDKHDSDKKEKANPNKNDTDKKKEKEDVAKEEKDENISVDVYNPEKPTLDDDEKVNGEESKDVVKVEKEEEQAKTKDKRNDKDKDTGLYCHVCKVSVYDDDSFKRHLNGQKHQNNMNSVITIQGMKKEDIMTRKKAEEHIRKIEKGRKNKEGRDIDYYCEVCDCDLTTSHKNHRFSTIHKQRSLQVRRGCGWCGKHNFKNFSEVLEHRKTEEHKKNAELHGKKDDKERKGSRRDQRKKKEEDEEDLTIPEYDAEKPVGLQYIVPVSGFFCKLCHKFYQSEKSAKGAHCQTETHYEKFKAATELKIQEREKKRAEKEAKKAAEEEARKADKEAVDREEEKMETVDGRENGSDDTEEAQENKSVEKDVDSSDMAQAHIELQKAEEEILQRQVATGSLGDGGQWVQPVSEGGDESSEVAETEKGNTKDPELDVPEAEPEAESQVGKPDAEADSPKDQEGDVSLSQVGKPDAEADSQEDQEGNVSLSQVEKSDAEANSQEDQEGDVSLSQEIEEAKEEAAAEPAKPVRRATARRGRGRARK